MSFCPNTTTTLSAFCKSFQTFSTVHSDLLKPTSALKFQCTLPIRQFSCFTNSTIQGKFLEPCHKPQKTSIRTKIVCSKKKGKGKSNYAVLSRFYRLRSGLWIRARSGRENKKWSKTEKRVRRLQQFVICNKTQSQLLDRMVTPYWVKKRYFPDDPYEIYQDRTNFKYAPIRPKYFP